MENNFDFFHLYYPRIIADSCCFFQSINGMYVDVPSVIKKRCKNIVYKNAEEIKFQDSTYLKLNKESIIKLDMPFNNDNFYFGVANISDNFDVAFLYWFNSNKEHVINIISEYLYKNLDIDIIERDSEKGYLTAVWSKNEK